MRFGYCTGLENAALIASAGYDYIEPALVWLLQPEAPESEVMPRLLEAARSLPIKIEAYNLLLPGDLKVTGPEVDADRQRRYLEAACSRAAALGGKVLVFGSGGARMVPEGFDRDEATRQIVSFLKLAGPIAQAQGITIVIEPLNREGCNIVISVAEGMELVRQAAHPSVQVLGDLFHINHDGQSYEETRRAGPAVRHVHVSGIKGRLPISDDIDYLANYFSILKQMGFAGRISIEVQMAHDILDSPMALEVIRSAWERA